MKESPTDAARYLAAKKALGLSLEAMARRLDVSLSTSQRYAGGKSPVPQRVLELVERWVAEAKQPKRAKKR